MKLIDAVIPNANVQWNNEVEAVPPSVQRGENVTVHNAGSKGSPAYFEISCVINATFDSGEGLNSTLYMAPRIAVLGRDREDAFIKIEDDALRQLPSMLRAVADQFDAQIAEWAAVQEDNVES